MFLAKNTVLWYIVIMKYRMSVLLFSTCLLVLGSTCSKTLHQENTASANNHAVITEPAYTNTQLNTAIRTPAHIPAAPEMINGIRLRSHAVNWSPEQLRSFADILYDNHIHHCYILFAQTVNSGDVTVNYFPEDMDSFINKINSYTRQQSVFLWFSGTIGTTVLLDDDYWIQNFNDSLTRAIETFGLNNFHFDFTLPIVSNTTFPVRDYAQWLRYLNHIYPSIHISITLSLHDINTAYMDNTTVWQQLFTEADEIIINLPDKTDLSSTAYNQNFKDGLQRINTLCAGLNTALNRIPHILLGITAPQHAFLKNSAESANSRDDQIYTIAYTAQHTANFINQTIHSGNVCYINGLCLLSLHSMVNEDWRAWQTSWITAASNLGMLR